MAWVWCGLWVGGMCWVWVGDVYEVWVDGGVWFWAGTVCWIWAVSIYGLWVVVMCSVGYGWTPSFQHKVFWGNLPELYQEVNISQCLVLFHFRKKIFLGSLCLLIMK